MKNLIYLIKALFGSAVVAMTGCVPHVCDHTACESLRKQEAVAAYARGKLDGDVLGYDRGHDDGNKAGYAAGYPQGVIEGDRRGEKRGRLKGLLKGYVEGAFSSFLEWNVFSVGAALAILMAIPVLGIPILMMARPVRRYIRKREAEAEAEYERAEALAHLGDFYQERYKEIRLEARNKVLKLQALAEERFAADLVAVEMAKATGEIFNRLLEAHLRAIVRRYSRQRDLIEETAQSDLPPTAKTNIFRLIQNNN